MIASFYDVLWINLDKNTSEIDIDNEFGISDIRAIINFESSFYILANKSDKKIGLFLIQINSNNPLEAIPNYIINQKGNSENGDADLYFTNNYI
jgi:hypothetical protein